MPLRYRRGTRGDVGTVLPLLRQDRPLFSAAMWRALPTLLDDLLVRERILLCVLEDCDTGQLRFVGGSGFLSASVLRGATCDARESLIERAMAAEIAHRPAFLNTRQIASANRAVDLRLLNFFGVPSQLDAAGIGKATEAWNFFHKGFQLRDIWCETADPVQRQLFAQMGLRLQGERTGRGGQPAWQFNITRQEALQSPASWPASAMLSPRPQFGFTRGHQKLLELALLDHSDREIAEHLGLSEDAVKKRWRSIYAKVARVETGPIRRDDSGANQRRSLFQRLRQNLEELRPF